MRDDLVERRNQAEKEKNEKKNAYFPPGVKNLIHAGDGQLAEAAELIEIILVHGDPNASILF